MVVPGSTVVFMQSTIRHAEHCPGCARERLRTFTTRVDRSGATIESPGPWVARCSNPRCPTHLADADTTATNTEARSLPASEPSTSAP